MNNNETPIEASQYFGDIVPEFQNKTIYNKYITGIGGTTAAINEGNCIVISPNVSGIVSKEGIENVIAVYGGITPMDIKTQYQTIRHKELKPVIITTPDSFTKILDALGSGIYQNYKCIIDELHCFPEAAGYRNILPTFIDSYFVRFICQSAITATYTHLSHPHFKDWTVVNFVPQFAFKHEIQLYSSKKHLYASVKAYLDSLPEQEKKLVFFNSLRQTECFKRQGLDFDTLCSTQSRDKEYVTNFRDFDSHLHRPVTFATSAYFQACDIKEQAHIVFVVDMQHVPHSMLTREQIIQALGRCRNGYLSVTMFVIPPCRTPHVNCSEHDIWQTLNDIAQQQLGATRALQTFCRNGNLPENIRQTERSQIFPLFEREMLRYNEVTEEYEIHWLNLDGEATAEYAYQQYGNTADLAAYLNEDDRLNVTVRDEYPIPNTALSDKMLNTKELTNAEVMEETIQAYMEARNSSICLGVLARSLSDNSLAKQVFSLCSSLGPLDRLDEIRKTKGAKQLLERLTHKVQSELISMEKDIRLKERVKGTFTRGCFYQSKDIKTRLQDIYDKFELPKRAKAKDILEYFSVEHGREISKRIGAQVVAGYHLL